MKKFYLFLFLFLIYSCGERKEVVEEKRSLRQKKIEKKVEERNLEEKDPLKEAMELLIQYKKDPENNELKEKVCAAFKDLAEKARKIGNINRAEEYLKIASMCNGEEGENFEFKENKPMDDSEGEEGFKVSLSNFDVKISGISKAAKADKILLIMDQGYMEITGELSLSLKDKIKAVLYTDQEFYDITGFPPWIGGAYDGRIHLPLANANTESEAFKKVVKHELTHAILHQATEGRCPTWLHEGLAQYFDGSILKGEKELLKELERGSIPPLNSPSFLLMERDKSILLYQLSLAAVFFLKERGSMGSISNFIKKIGDGEDIEKSFYEAFLFPYEDLTQRIKEYLKIKK